MAQPAKVIDTAGVLMDWSIRDFTQECEKIRDAAKHGDTITCHILEAKALEHAKRAIHHAKTF